MNKMRQGENLIGELGFRRGNPARRPGIDRRRCSGDPGDQRRGARGAARLGELACMIGVPRRGLLRRVHVDGGLQAMAVLLSMKSINLLQEKVRGWSEMMHKREGRGKGKKLVALAHGFVIQCSGWSRYWEASGEESPWVWRRFLGKIKGRWERSVWGTYRHGSRMKRPGIYRN
jgi:hypothetical protein